MKKLISLILIFSNLSYADCNWSTIQPLKDGNFEYPVDVHLCVGKLSQDSDVKDKQIQDLTAAVDLKNAALSVADQRTQLWQTTADNEMDRLNKLSSDQKRSDWLYFGLGVLTVLGSGFLAARLSGR